MGMDEETVREAEEWPGLTPGSVRDEKGEGVQRSPGEAASRRLHFIGREMQVGRVLTRVSRSADEPQNVAASDAHPFLEPEGVPREVSVVVAATGAGINLIDADTARGRFPRGDE